MAWLSELIAKWRVWQRREQFETDLEEEMRLHVELREQRHRAGGLDPAQAHSAATRGFGNATYLREQSRDAWAVAWLQQLSQDLRYGLRTMGRTPGFTAIAVIALALGIGANTAIFSVVNAVLLRPLPYKDPQQLVTVMHHGAAPVAAGNYFDWRSQSRSFTAMGGADYWTPNLTGMDAPEHLWGLKVTQDIFPLLGIEPILGRVFQPGEDEEGREHVVVLSYRLWQRRFAGERNVLGKTMRLDGVPYTVIGVMPAAFQFAPFWATRAELWAPDVLAGEAHIRNGNHLRVFARLKSGVSLKQARAEIAAITAHLEEQYPGTNRHVEVTPLKEQVVGKIETPMLVLVSAVGLVLLIACANVAHMLLARASARRREIAVRAALGAGRARMVRQFLTESLLLAVMGGAAGLLLAYLGTHALVALSPKNIPRVQTVAIDLHVVLFLQGVTLLAGLLFGLAPVTHASLSDLAGAVKEGGRGGTEGAARNRLRSLLMTSEFALALMLLIGAGLLIRSFAALERVDPGFDPHHVLSMVVSVAGSSEADAGRREVFYRELISRVRHLPAIESAGAINHLPLLGDLWGWDFRIEGRPESKPGESPGSVYRMITPGYLASMQMQLVRGRDISESDTLDAPRVVLINQAAARRYWQGEDPLGKRISFGRDTDGKPSWATITGIVKDTRQYGWKDKPEPETYLALFQSKEMMAATAAHFEYITLVARTAGASAAMLPAVKETVWRMDRNLPLSDVITMEQVVADATAEPRFEMMLLGLFAAVALALAAVGIYGVMSYAVSRRTNEIGIRVSLGATRGQVLWMVLRQGLRLVVFGTLLGAAGALLLTRLMTGLLYTVKPTDPVTFISGAVVLAVVALVATGVPAWRAARIDPVTALRCE